MPTLISDVAHRRYFSSASRVGRLCLGGTIVSVTNRKLCVGVPAISKNVPFRRQALRFPAFVTTELDRLQHEIIHSLMEHSMVGLSADSAYSLSSSSSFARSLEKMAKYYFDQGGKLFRPTVALLMANACNQMKSGENLKDSCEAVSLNQYKIAMISEMIHTASLVHDDVIDESSVRRGNPTVNAIWGNKMAVLVGDFILARATQVLCSIGEPDVISVMALIIEDLVKGELLQMTSGGSGDCSQQFQSYMAKTYSKTASLFANTCKAVAMLADVSASQKLLAFEYGRSLGLAFQLVDDLLDFVSSSATMGKPTATDLKLGLATAPVLFAAQDYPQLNRLISRRFSEAGDVNDAWEMVVNSRGIERTRAMAKQHSHEAAKTASGFPNGNGVRDHLVELALRQMDRDR